MADGAAHDDGGRRRRAERDDFTTSKDVRSSTFLAAFLAFSRFLFVCVTCRCLNGYTL